MALIVLFSLGSSGTKGFAASKINQDELNAYLSEVRMTQEELEEYLSYYDLTLNELKSAEELRETLGPAVTPETLQNLLKQYEMTEAELTELLMEYGELEEGDSIIDTIHFIYDIEDIIDLEMDYDEEEISDLMDGLFTEIGLTDEDELEKGVGHYAGSVLPGEKDNSVLSGHRDTIFRDLGEVGEGDLLIAKTEAGTFTYKVRKVRIVDAEDRTVIVPKPKATLTVTTCYPFSYIGSAPERYVLVADLLKSE
ncbi:processed acidic surface protein [Peribacillus frigoritolerans]|uniref:processed acidic surface protein n=1 Tax=Peribacillus frigoritolerans TaxID=450367 RepID=UPI00382B98D0